MPVLGEWILRAACDEAASWPVHLRLAVNVTKGQLNPSFAAMLTNALASSGLSPDRLDLEVQEAVLTGEDPAAREALLAAHQLGVALCLDDFGCGPTSLTSLKDVPLDRLKLHPTFLTSALNKNARGRTLATALMRLAEGLGMQVTAEGAERLEELQLIRSLGCDHVQGYLFGRPMGQAEARAFAAESKPIDAKEAALRRPPRHSLIRRATLHAGTEQWPVRLRNISAGGAMVESKRQLAVGQRVELDLGDQVRLLATVRWSHDERLGVQFTDAFDLARFGRVKRDVPEVRMLTPEYLQESPAVPSAPAVITIKKVRRS
jgi:EAL domain-containing protein (putative c-di-GMP-specific phosphodiesterase class I)